MPTFLRTLLVVLAASVVGVLGYYSYSIATDTLSSPFL